MVKIAFLGDISFNDEYVNLAKQNKNPFKGVKHILNEADYIVGNLECFVKGKGENLLKAPRLITEEITLPYLKELGVKLVSLANNHVYDNLIEGFQSTLNFLNVHQIDHFGCSVEKEFQYKPFIKEINGIRFGFLNYVTEDTHLSLPADANIYPNIFQLAQIERDIKDVRGKVDFCIVLLHWGGLVDYGYYPHSLQRKQAKAIIEAGADLIVGHHSHTFQAFEKFQEKEVFYSIGNFCFADIQNGRKKIMIRKSGKESAILMIEFEGKSYRHQLRGFENDNLYLKENPIINRKILRRTRYFRIFKTLKGFDTVYLWYLRKIEPMINYYQASDKSFVGKIKTLNFTKIKDLLRSGK